MALPTKPIFVADFVTGTAVVAVVAEVLLLFPLVVAVEFVASSVVGVGPFAVVVTDAVAEVDGWLVVFVTFSGFIATPERGTVSGLDTDATGSDTRPSRYASGEIDWNRFNPVAVSYVE